MAENENRPGRGRQGKSGTSAALPLITIILLVAALVLFIGHIVTRGNEKPAGQAEEESAVAVGEDGDPEPDAGNNGSGTEENEPGMGTHKPGTENSQPESTAAPAENEAVSEAGQEESADPENAEGNLDEIIANMPLRDKIAQMFVLTPEALTGADTVTAAGEATKAAIDEHPVGGLVYFKNNIQSEAQCSEMAGNVQSYSYARTGLPMLLCVDEEGGQVARISGRGMENVPDISPMYYVGQGGRTSDAYDVGNQIGTYLARFGLNADFAPVADVFSNEKNTVIGTRSYGSSPELVAQMVSGEIEGLKAHRIAATLKHFPGHGDTAEDSHYGNAYSYKTLEELRSCEFIPFKEGIKAGADMVMVGHISLPNVLEDNTPASLSYQMITQVLREELGFDGVVITDALSMGAISENYGSANASVLAVQAGVDLLLMPEDFNSAYEGLLDAVEQGVISEDRIDQSLARIIKLKWQIS